MTSTIITFSALTSLVAYDYFFSHKIFGKKILQDDEDPPQTISGNLKSEGTPNFKLNDKNSAVGVVPRVRPSPRPDFHNYGVNPPKSSTKSE